MQNSDSNSSKYFVPKKTLAAWIQEPNKKATSKEENQREL